MAAMLEWRKLVDEALQTVRELIAEIRQLRAELAAHRRERV
jgi:hypothetical protein